jgi:D-inositol-3-phosphate glycosyltransferase
MGKKRFLAIGDQVAPTGFSQVLTNILLNLNREEYEIHALGVNYKGDPHPYPWSIYPALLGGTYGGHPDYMGFNRIEHFAGVDWDCIFILNDPWVINKYLELIKKYFVSKLPPIIAYFPIDAMELNPNWFSNFDIVTKIVTYTEFARNEILKVRPDLVVEVVPHGIDLDIYKKIYKESRAELRQEAFSKSPELWDAFIVLNANRNNPRKRFDLTIQSFALFAKDKPDNVLLYLHTGLVDIGFNILELIQKYGLENRLITSNASKALQSVPEAQLNHIYNMCDIGLSTSIAEGWSLTNHEHAATGAPQVVPSHSALKELYTDCGITVPVYMWLTDREKNTLSGYVHPLHVAEELNKIYYNKELYNDISKKSIEKFGSIEYSWKYIVDNKWIPMFKEIGL